MRTTAEIEKKIAMLLGEMTLEEKVSLCHANSKFTVASVERLGIEELTMSDGPHGVRPELDRHSWRNLRRSEDACTYLPTGTALAATWNPKLGNEYGKVLGSEARYRGKDIILGPGVNVIRSPLCGRNFEYMSEDPCLISKMAPGLVQGIQSQDTAACVKHYCLNNQELDRFSVNIEVSRRALHEIYLKGFYAAIMEGGAASVMGAYNKYENQYCCHHDYLVNRVLKGTWGFDGVYLTDWGGAHSTDESIYHGLDIEMGTNAPYDAYYLAEAFLERARESQEVRELLDDKVRRILRLMYSVNKFSAERKQGAFNTKEHQQTSYAVAAEAMVLLKNENKLLPLDKSKLKKVLVVGPNADKKHASGGNSSGVSALYEVTPLQGAIDRLSAYCEVEYESGALAAAYHPVAPQMLNIIDTVAGCRAYKHIAHAKDTAVQKVEFREDANVYGGTADRYDISFSVDIPETGNFAFRFQTNGNARIKINGVEQANIRYWRQFPDQEFTCAFDYEKGAQVDFDIHVVREKATVDFTFGWMTPWDRAESSSEAELLEKAKSADCVIYCGGLDHSFDTESFDKKTMLLPSEQDVLIPKLIHANPNTVVVMTAGSPVAMPWIDKAKAVVWSWYAGMETGHVLFDILTGAVCPSGKLPFTLPKVYGDTPVARYGEYQEGKCTYKEDILVGYRGFDYDDIVPMFPFGHGLSYGDFEYSDLAVDVQREQIVVTFKVKNTGSVTAMETAQLYIGDPVCSVMRPVKELRNFKKVKLQPGETALVSLPVSVMDLCYYDEISDGWKLEDGEFTVLIGASSRDIRLEGSFHYTLTEV